MVAGRDFDLAFAPERVNPGDPASAQKTVPRLVGGMTPAATTRAATLLRNINATVIELSSPDAAELAKLLENVFRNVNIALVNQLALLCERMGLDVWEVIDAAATKPFGFMRFTPGPGVGGHCIPVDPYYLAWRAREFDFVDRFVELAGDINFAMPRHVVDLVAEALNEHGRAIKGARVGILGVAFKPNVRDARNSPAAEVMAILAERGASVAFHDPHVAKFKDTSGQDRESAGLEELLASCDVVVVVTAHTAIDWERVYGAAPLIVDTVNSSRGRATRDRTVLRLGAGWAAALTAGPLVLRPATAADADLLLDWANDPVTRASGFHRNAISRLEHARWLAARLASPTTRLWIGVVGDEPVGQIRFDREADGVAEIGIAIAPIARGRGLGRQLLAAGLAAARADASFAPAGFLARVRPENAASLALFRGAGFVETGREAVRGLASVSFRLR